MDGFKGIVGDYLGVISRKQCDDIQVEIMVIYFENFRYYLKEI